MPPSLTMLAGGFDVVAVKKCYCYLFYYIFCDLNVRTREEHSCKFVDFVKRPYFKYIFLLPRFVRFLPFLSLSFPSITIFSFFSLSERDTMNNSTDVGFVFNTSEGNIVAAFFVALLMLLTLVGNTMVCACFYYYRDLRTICNYFIISLSAADILVALLAMPFWLVLQLTDMDEKSRSVFSGELYSFWASIDILVGSASIMNLVAVSFDRHLAITAPFSYSESLTSLRAIIMIVALWVFSILLCGLHVPSVKMAKMRSAYQIGLVVVSFIVPLFLMFVMYMKIYFVARNQALRIGRNYARDIKATKTIAIVIGAFVVCWMPFFAIITLYALKPDYKVNIEAYKAIKWLEYLNSFLNPIIYTCLNRTYRRAFRKLLLRPSCCTGRGSSERLNCVQSTHTSFHMTKAESLSHSSSSVSENGNVCIQRSIKMEGTRV